MSNHDFSSHFAPSASLRWTRRVGLLGAGMIVGILCLAPGASATVYRTEITDPVDHPGDRGRDITRVITSFDNATGRWQASVSFAAAPTSSSSAPLRVAMSFARGACTLGAGNLLFQTPSAGDKADYGQGCRQTAQPFPPVSRTVSDRGRTISLEVVDPVLIGLVPFELDQTVLVHTNFSEFDTAQATRIFAPGAPATLLLGPSAHLSVSSQGGVKVPVAGVSQRAYAMLRLVTTSGVTLATRQLIIAPGLPELTLHLSKAARTRISRDGTAAHLQGTLVGPDGTTRHIDLKLSLIPH
jgi:hypothetical protein